MNYDDKQNLFSELYDHIGETITEKDYKQFVNTSNGWSEYPKYKPPYERFYIVAYINSSIEYDVCKYDIEINSFRGAKSKIIAWKSFEKYI